MAVPELAIETHGLRKTYRTVRGRTVGVEGLDLTVPVGGVHGFLGPNGSGKTTTIRMLLGLVRPDSGSATIFGVEVPRHLPDVVARVGAIVESPKFFPAFSARRNLVLLAEGIGAPRARVDEVIEQVGLTGRARDRYRTYSLGMKQRLAIAATLLKDPDLLIFDEPTNGLDPAGIHEIRQTMRSLGDQGKTVLVSSHILAEVEQVADTVSIVTRGRLVASGTVAELLGEQSGATVRVRLGADDVAAAEKVLTTAGYVVRAEEGAVVVEGAADAAAVNRLLGVQGMWASEIVADRPDLESVFLGLTQHETPGGHSHHSGRRLWGGGSQDGRHAGQGDDEAAAPQGAGGESTDESTDEVRA